MDEEVFFSEARRKGFFFITTIGREAYPYLHLILKGLIV